MKKMLALALTAAMTLSLAACGGSAPASSAAPAAASPAASEAAPAAQDAKLVYWTMWNEAEPQGQVIGEAAKAFTEATGIQIEVNYNGREIRKTLQPALDAGTVVDLFDEDVERVNGTWGSYLMSLEDYATQAYDSTGGKPYSESINKTLLDLARTLGPDGKLSTIPYQPSAFIMMYNKAIFAEAGIEKAPATWEEFLTACEKIKAIGKTPITVDDAYMACLFGYHMSRLAGVDKTVAMGETAKFDDPAVLTFGEQWAEMVAKGYVSEKAAANVWPAGQQDIASGDVAMYLNGTWLPNEIKDSTGPDFQWGAFAYPAVAAEGAGTEANNFGAQCFGINKNSKYPAEAFQFIVFMTTGEWDAKLAEQSIGVPMGNDSAWPAQLAEAKSVIDATTTRMPWAVGCETTDANPKIKENLAKLFSGALDAQGFADAMK